jgi:hypothetical protein
MTDLMYASPSKCCLYRSPYHSSPGKGELSFLLSHRIVPISLTDSCTPQTSHCPYPTESQPRRWQAMTSATRHSSGSKASQHITAYHSLSCDIFSNVVAARLARLTLRTDYSQLSLLSHLLRRVMVLRFPSVPVSTMPTPNALWSLNATQVLELHQNDSFAVEEYVQVLLNRVQIKDHSGQACAHINMFSVPS